MNSQVCTDGFIYETIDSHYPAHQNGVKWDIAIPALSVVVLVMVNAYPRSSAAARGYGSKWQKARLTFLNSNPLCVFCSGMGRVTAATVVDHKVPHKGNQSLFWDVKNWQPLCKSCHDSEKQRIENGNEIKQVGLDGWPEGFK